MERQILSKSIIYVYLVNHSTYFPDLIRGACAFQGVAFRDEMVPAIAANSTVLSQIALFENSSIDASLMDIMVDPDKAQKFDNDIAYLVAQYGKVEV